MATKGGEYVTIEDGIHALKVGSRIFVNDWGNEFTVYGVSENFAVAHQPETHEYTIITEEPRRVYLQRHSRWFVRVLYG